MKMNPWYDLRRWQIKAYADTEARRELNTGHIMNKTPIWRAHNNVFVVAHFGDRGTVEALERQK